MYINKHKLLTSKIYTKIYIIVNWKNPLADAKFELGYSQSQTLSPCCKSKLTGKGTEVLSVLYLCYLIMNNNYEQQRFSYICPSIV